MDLVTEIVALVTKTLSVAFSRLLADEIVLELASLSSTLINFATSRLPDYQRERYAEEWKSHVADTRGNFRKLLEAIGFVRVALAVALRESILSKAANLCTEMENFGVAVESEIDRALAEGLPAARDARSGLDTVRDSLLIAREEGRNCLVSIDEFRANVSDGLVVNVYFAAWDWLHMRKQRQKASEQINRARASIEILKKMTDDYSRSRQTSADD